MENQETPKENTEVEQPVEEVNTPEDRPEENYKAELARKNAEIARLRAENEVRNQPVEKKRDPTDISTWSTQELKMLRNSNDPSVAQYKEQADDLILERKVKEIEARNYENRRREETNQKLREEYPEALDNTSEFGSKVEKVMREYDLSRTPAGRLVAAKIVASEAKASNAKGQDKESKRVAALKANMTEGDRPKPVEASNPNKEKALKDKLLKENSTSHDATAEWIDSRGLREKFGKMWGK